MTMQFTFTLEEKLGELDREIAQRHRVYAWQVRKGKLDKNEAARRIRILTAIANEYRDRAKEGPLFRRETANG